MSALELGIIGNGMVAGLIDPNGAMKWLCFPRLDGEPIIDSLVGGAGRFDIEIKDFETSTQKYDGNTAILVTTLKDKNGGAVEITDFCPRFETRGRMFTPMSVVRNIKIISGTPQIKVILNFQANWGRSKVSISEGVSHISYNTGENAFRLTTDMPLDYIRAQRWFRLESDGHIILGPEESVTSDVARLCADWQERTAHYWKSWARTLAIPYEWQDAVLRSAITLKLCVYEKTGGIVAALTTSIPEHEGSERNWDYRYCWLRDAYFVVTAFNRLASMDTLENYVKYVRNIIAETGDGHIQPVFGIGLETDLTENIIDGLSGYLGHGPVRNGNQAYEHIQHDVYGQAILSASQAFFDKRLFFNPSLSDFKELERVGERAYKMHDQADAGIWEFRTQAQVHTSSAIMCWAACDRLAKIAAFLNLEARVEIWRSRADEIHQTVLDKAYNEKIGAFTAAYGGDTLDASVLLMAEIGFLDADSEKYRSTVEVIDKNLRVGNHVFRYKSADDFGEPETAFTACTFWLIDALHRIGRKDQAREMFEDVLRSRTKLGLLSEDIDPETGQLWGNFPQTYCMVGIVNSANLLSVPWTSIV